MIILTVILPLDLYTMKSSLATENNIRKRCDFQQKDKEKCVTFNKMRKTEHWWWDPPVSSIFLYVVKYNLDLYFIVILNNRNNDKDTIVISELGRSTYEGKADKDGKDLNEMSKGNNEQ